jgi:hypothetical protein
LSIATEFICQYFAVADNKVNDRKGSTVKNLTFTFGAEELSIIDNQINRLLKRGIYVSKSELMRIGLKLIEQTKTNDLDELPQLIKRHLRGRQQLR